MRKGLGNWTKPVLSADEARRVGSLADAQPLTPWPIGMAESNVHVGRLPLSEETRWLYERMMGIARALNTDLYGFDLYGLEAMHYMRYTATERPAVNNYWHMDIGLEKSNEPQRKLSLVLQLSHPDEYDGGDLVIQQANEPFIVPKGIGMLHAFPAWMLHRVTPVTRGARRTIPFWAIGPDFR
jgi:PKHD-type hydroxylase